MLGNSSWTDVEDIGGVRKLQQICTAGKQKLTVSIEGNIGCGKSTLLDHFHKCAAVTSLKEPVEQWTNIQGYNALELLYKDPARWNFSFNNYAMLTRVQMHQYRSDLPVKMLERSLYSTKNVFIQNSYDNKLLTEVEYAVLSQWYDYLIETQDIGVDLFVYLRAPPEVCYERIKKRNRKEETGVPFKFVKELHELHEEWLIRRQTQLSTPVLVLDASPELPRMQQIYEERKSEILCGCT